MHRHKGPHFFQLRPPRALEQPISGEPCDSRVYARSSQSCSVQGKVHCVAARAADHSPKHSLLQSSHTNFRKLRIGPKSRSTSGFCTPSSLPYASPREPPCACAPAPGGKLLCADGLDGGARLLWRRDRPALPMLPWARKREPEIDPFVILSTVQGYVAPPQSLPSS